MKKQNLINDLKKTIALCTCVASITSLSACSSTSAQVATTSTTETLNVVATTTMLYDLTSIIGGDNVEAIGLMGVGIDPHLYTASAGDVTKMTDADVVVYNGIHLEAQLGEVFSSLDEQGKNVICIEYGIDPSMLLEDEESSDSSDPHVWFDVTIWMQAADYLAESLCEIDPNNAEEYQANLDLYIAELEELHQYVTDRVEELPEQHRVLITAHDAFNYFGNAYGFEVKGLQGISTETEAGTGDVSELASFIAENEIKAIFVESSVSSKNIEALQEAVKALGFDVEIGGELYSDSLGDASSGHDTYIATFKSNIDTIVDALK